MEREVKVISKVVGPESVFCPGFTDADGKRHSYHVIIAPITVEFEYEGSVAVAKISYGCSAGPLCQNRNCRYSKAYKEMLEWAREGEG